MKIIIKGKNIKLDANLEDYVTEKIRKFEKMIEEPAIAEVRLEDMFGPQGGEDKLVHIYLTLPKLKNPIHLQAQTSDFFGSIDLLEDKLRTEVIKYKEKYKIGSRYPTKYHTAELEEESVDEV